MKNGKVERRCVYNALINCSGASAKCTSCGWSPAENKRRKELIHVNRLSEDEDGLKYLALRLPEQT